MNARIGMPQIGIEQLYDSVVAHPQINRSARR